MPKPQRRLLFPSILITFSRVLADAPRWLFLGVLVFAPWAYGCTEAWSIEILNFWMGCMVLLWLGAMALQGKPAEIHPLLLCGVLFLLGEGWWLAVNAHYRFDAEHHAFLPIVAWWKTAPGSVDQVTSASMMIRLSGILGGLCFASDLAKNAVWRIRLLGTMGAVGCSVILLGLVQRITAAPMIFWEEGRQGSQFFATYYYHANAASFINLVLPASAGMLWRAVRQPRAYLARALWSSMFLVTLAGAFVNVSRAGMVVTGILIVILLWWRRKYLLEAIGTLPRRISVIYSALALLALFSVITSVGWHTAADRWSELAGELQTKNARLLVAAACWRMLPDSGWWGFGPGTFEITFPHYTAYLGNEVAGIWRFAHEDYLQTAIEWGWIGASVWGLLLFGSIGSGYFRYGREFKKMTADQRIALFTSATALWGMALHATVDFPFQIASLQLYAATYVGIVWGSGPRSGKE